MRATQRATIVYQIIPNPIKCFERNEFYGIMSATQSKTELTHNVIGIDFFIFYPTIIYIKKNLFMIQINLKKKFKSITGSDSTRPK